MTLRTFLRRVTLARAAFSRFNRIRRVLDTRTAPHALPELRDALRDFKADYRVARFENDALERGIAWTRINDTKRRINRLEALL
jgi:hypothetical protein